MRIKPFSEKTTDNLIASQNAKVKSRIDNLTNEEIMANDMEILAENLYQEFYIMPVEIYEEDFKK